MLWQRRPEGDTGYPTGDTVLENIAIRRRYFVAYFGIALTLLLGAFGLAAYWADSETVLDHEARFNEQQALQVSLAKQGLRDQITTSIQHLTDLANHAGSGGDITDTALSDRIFPRLFGRTEFLAAAIVDQGKTLHRSAQATAESKSNVDRLLWESEEVLRTTTPTMVPWVSRITAKPATQIVALAMPISGAGFAGSPWLVAVIDLRHFLEQYVAPMRSGKFGAGYALDGQGQIVYDHETEIIGRNVFDGMHEKYPQLLALDKRMVAEPSGISEYRFTVKRGGAVSRKLIAWNSVEIGERKIVLALSAPDVEINASLEAQRRAIGIAGALLLIGLTGIIALFFRMRQQLLEDTADQLTRTMVERTQELDSELAARKQSEDRFRDIAASASDWFWEMDENLRFTFVSDRFMETTGIPLDQIIGKSRRDMAAEYADDPYWQQHFRMLEAHQPFRNFEYQHEVPDGRRISVSVSGTPVFDASGEFKGYRGTTADITSQVQAQQARDQALAEAETANRAKSEFLAAMSHEFRTPLNAIMGFSEVISNRSLGIVELGKYREYADDIHRSARHLLDLVNDLLDISAIEAGKHKLDMEDLNVSDLVDEAMRAVHDKAYSQDIKVSSDIPELLPPISADRRAVRQILLNLLTNAIKFTPKQGTVTVTADVSSTDMYIKVADTGIGIEKGDLAGIANPFVQGGRNSYTTEEEGWGLGLSITNALVERHGGNLLIESVPGEGTTVTVILPRSTPVAIFGTG